MNILVVGGFDEGDPEAGVIGAYAQALGREIIQQGHTLLNGCQTAFDAIVAEAAAQALTTQSSPRERIVSYVLAGTKPTHTFGRVINSRLTSWDPGDGGLFAPEPIQRADVLIIVRGFEGSFRAAHWADTVKKPVLPVAYFGGAGRKLYDNIFDHFENRYGGRLEKSDFEELNAYGSNWPDLAKLVVTVAEKAATPKTVVALMSYRREGDLAVALRNAFYTFEQVCREFGYNCVRVDETNASDRILPRILEFVERAAFVIVDLTDLKPNVFFELGYAEGLRKPRVVTAQEKTELPFDIKDFPVTFWNPLDMKRLHDDMSARVGVIAEEQGRTPRTRSA